VQLAKLNGQILRVAGSQSDVPGLLDQRQMLIDEFSEIIPIRQIARENGTVALYSMGGALLLDATPATFGFAPTSPITPDMSLQSGALSGLTINGQPVATGKEFSPIAGGTLSALFDIRDVRSVEAQEAVDALAGDLIARFEGSAVDPTLLPSDAGLFTDGGSVYDSADVVGLSGRLGVNAAVVPADGGQLWRIRDGIGAAIPGPAGDSSLLSQLSAAISSLQTPVSGGFGGAARTFSGLSSDLLSRFGQAQLGSERSLAFDQARRDSLRQSELANGVDTDQEMQKLLLIEQAYSANARVIQTADQLIQTLLEI
jgi:flagellar hook-associated protein 1 FlgK